MLKWVLRINGLFLAVVGLLLMTFVLSSHFFSIGLFGNIFSEIMPQATLGFSESFFLAFILGIVLIVVSQAEYPRLWNGIAAFTHLGLGTANITFWSSFFAEFDMVAPGVTLTVVHALFVVLQTYCIRLPRG